MQVTLIDGPSGSGKTTFAGRLAASTGAQLVHLDDFYPGWHGLAAGAEAVARDVLDPSRPGYRRWDWERDRAGEWVALEPGRDLIVEGVGAITPASIERARALGPTRLLLIDGPADLRRRRALARDPGFEPWWLMWAEQERGHFAQLENLATGAGVVRLPMAADSEERKGPPLGGGRR